MKECAWCGRENDDDAIYCRECGTTFVVPEPLEPPGEQKTETVDEFPELVPDVSPSGEYALCPSCVFPNVPDVQWCRRCGAPLNFISTIGPVEAAIATGSVWRGALRGHPKIFVLLSVWFLFFPRFLSCVLTIFAAPAIGGPFGMFTLALSGGYGAVSVVMLYRVTKNYLTIPKPHLDDAAASPALRV